MIILDDLKDINAIYGILEKVGSEVNNYYWRDNSSVDYERAGELHKLEKHLIERGYIDSDYDLAELTYKFLDLYPQSITARENNRQYHEVLNKLDERVRGELLYKICIMEKDTGERLDKSVKFNMALDCLLEQYEFSEEIDDEWN